MARKKAFTLVEVIIVIVIVAILAILAISSYGIARERAKLDLMADSIVGELKGQQELAKSGRVYLFESGESSIACRGLLFATEKPEEKDSYIYYITAPYVAVGNFGAAYCDMDKLEKSVFLMDRGFEIGEIKKGSNNFDSIQIMFKPPDAVATYADRNIQSQHVQKETEKVELTLQIRNISGDVLERNKKYIKFDPISGITERMIPKKENGD
jgi:prepilin-type N-terminal cleavage/methylation domain-containing protein